MPNFKPNPDGMKPSGFKMKNSALQASARTGSPMQSNYKASPVKVWPIIAKIAAGAVKAGKAVATAAKAGGAAAKAGGAVGKAAKGANAIAKAGKGVKGAVEVASTAKEVGGFKGIVGKSELYTRVKSIAGKAKAAYDKGGMVKKVVDAAAEGAVGNIMSPKEEEEKVSITGDQKSIM
tara:strand:+ start:119 stop:652 length:534 start_codon:yes stop_codon:yes gene_type:complete